MADDWVRLIEGSECPPSTGEITCAEHGPWRHIKFPAGAFTVSRQVSVPENTVIEGVDNPNDEDKTKKPDYSRQTVFVASDGLSDGQACYCQNLKRTWEPLSPSNPYHCQDLTNEQVKSLRKGFLMFSNTVVKNIAFQGKDTLRPSDNGALCGGGVFETPGCVHNQCKFPHLMTGDGKPVTNVAIENVRLNDYMADPELASQLAVWVAQTTDTETPTSDVRVKNLVAMFLHADGINFHGFVQNAIVDDCYIQNTGDDIYAVWGSHFDTKGIVFQNSVGVDAGRARQNHYGSCVAVYGAKEATFRNLKCFAPEQNTRDCYDSRHNGETCNGCLGIIKESFDADYSGSVFTFTDNKFYVLKRWEENGHQIYDLTNPEETGRPEICNNEWTKGGLTINVDVASYTSLGGVAVDEGNGVGTAKYDCDLSCCKAYCTSQPACNSFAWSAQYQQCFLKDAVLQEGSAVFTTYIQNQ
ncbi:unnamed protein product [Polarella glacialis]|uniref:Alpha-1,3-glucanase catalytic domain-containing protein n=1 Tax=Polarella glacialis TaxID=89957 RepID=A0A813HN44_POLGL|nr:unnamed protein product [Polarella glacialis]